MKDFDELVSRLNDLNEENDKAFLKKSVGSLIQESIEDQEELDAQKARELTAYAKQRILQKEIESIDEFIRSAISNGEYEYTYNSQFYLRSPEITDIIRHFQRRGFKVMADFDLLNTKRTRITVSWD